MKFSLLFLLALTWFSTTNAQSDSTLDAIAKQESAVFNSYPQKVFTSYNYDVSYYKLQLALNPDTAYISGTISMQFSIEQASDSMIIDMDGNLKVDKISGYCGACSFVHHLKDDKLLIKNPPLSKNTNYQLQISYHGSPENSGLGSFQTDKKAGPRLWTLSEPYGAKDWWPCKQSTDDKADSVDIEITCPSAYIATSNGVLQKTTGNQSNTTFYYKHKYPIASYLICAAVANYEITKDSILLKNGLMPLINYNTPGTSADANYSTSVIKPFLQLYDTLLGPYPFAKEKLGFTQFGRGGGMEHQTNIFVAGYNVDLWMHEMVHQWFGDKITNSSWKDIWIHEGFATYFAGYYKLYQNPSYFNEWKKLNIIPAAKADTGSIYVNDTTSVARIFNQTLSYYKASYVIHMLRCQLGDSAFFAALRNYLADPQLAYGFANTKQLKTHFEKASGTDLSIFFKQWIYGEGIPSYKLSWTQDNEILNITLHQSSTSRKTTFFQMPVPIRLKSFNKDTTLILQHRFSGQGFQFKIPFKVFSIEFDPDLCLLSKNNQVVNTSSQASEIVLYPNPAQGKIKIKNQKLDEAILNLKILNADGQLVSEFNFSKNEQDQGEFELNVEKLKAGVYTAKIITNAQTYFQKFVLQ